MCPWAIRVDGVLMVLLARRYADYANWVISLGSRTRAATFGFLAHVDGTSLATGVDPWARFGVRTQANSHRTWILFA